jgi:hypothetical protein
MDWLWVLVVALRAVSPAPEDVWATRLGELDAVRAQAFASGDPAGLGEVYVRSSRGAAADARTIRAYRRRGGRVLGAELRVLSCRVLADTRTRARLDVVDRLGPAQVLWSDGTSTALPQDEPTRRIVTLVRTDEGWRIVRVAEVR